MPASVILLLIPSAYSADKLYKEGCLNITAALDSGSTVDKLGRSYCKEKGVVKIQFKQLMSFLAS